MPITTGSYAGNGSTARFDTRLTTIRAVSIYELAPRGPGGQAYTNDALQLLGQGTFLNGAKKDSGIAFDVSTVVVTSPDFTIQGSTFAWEARGD